jgi:hypothetical protein
MFGRLRFGVVVDDADCIIIIIIIIILVPKNNSTKREVVLLNQKLKFMIVNYNGFTLFSFAD